MRAPSPPEAFYKGRRYPTHTPLGKLMAHLTMSKSEMARLSGVHERTLTEYLAGRKDLSVDHARRFAEVLEIDVRHLLKPAGGRRRP